MNVEILGSNSITKGSQLFIPATSNETLITGWVVDSSGRSDIAADVVVDNVPLPVEYGYARPDVVRFLSSPEAMASGFRGWLPALTAGEHRIAMRVIPKGQHIYCETWAFRVLVR